MFNMYIMFPFPTWKPSREVRILLPVSDEIGAEITWLIGAAREATQRVGKPPSLRMSVKLPVALPTVGDSCVIPITQRQGNGYMCRRMKKPTS